MLSLLSVKRSRNSPQQKRQPIRRNLQTLRRARPDNDWQECQRASRKILEHQARLGGVKSAHRERRASPDEPKLHRASGAKTAHDQRWHGAAQ